MAQIKVGSGLTKPKAIHVYKNGAWQKKKVGHVFKNGVWIPFIKYELWLYQLGKEYVEFEYTGNNAQLIKRTDQMNLSTNMGPNNTGGNAYLKTKNRITLTEYSKLYFDVKPHFVTSDRDTGSVGVHSASGFKEPTEAKRSFGVNNVRSVVEVDVSSLAGDYFVSMYLETKYGTPYVEIYNIWLE